MKSINEEIGVSGAAEKHLSPHRRDDDSFVVYRRHCSATSAQTEEPAALAR